MINKNSINKIVSDILNKSIRVNSFKEIEHPGDGNIVWFKIKDKEYILKSYPTKPKVTNIEIKNWENINHINHIHKQTYYGNSQGYFMLSFTKGWLFQYLLDHKPNENLLGIFEKSIEQLVLIHSSLNLIKDKRKLRKRFTQQGLTHYLSKAMKNIQAGMIDYRKRFGKADPLWNQRLKQINLKVLTKNLSITDETKVLIHGDFKPNNIIFNGEEVIIIDWLGMMAGTPWYDLAYLTYQLPKQKQIHLVKMYHDQMRTKSYFTNLSKSQFLNSFLLGKTFQQIVRANSNVGKILQNNNAHYVKEFCSALDALVKLTRKEQ